MSDVTRQIEAFFAAYPKKTYDKGHIITYAGDDPAGICYIASGMVRQYDINSRGDEIVVNVFKPGAFYPMIWAVTRSENNYFYAAMSEVEVYQAPADDVVAFLKSHPDCMFDLLGRLMSGAEGLQRRMAHLMGGTARSRLLFELLLECDRFGNIQPDGSCSISTNESEFAQRTGMSRETVNREMMKLRREGVLTRSGKIITVQHVTRLHELLDNTL